ncbi:dienelactone hydrolase [Ventosimonas gracilis]|uniref:Dihydromonapterin reductase n=1 Tax=Ventosimonas gracilis TaxID=1680762 RepID=A0A139SVN6_9GAMM|nr:dihydromonapterin reductase [Ventosimonas gracilis]KXU38512.1 dienelactone hydrolase [Ventosimonas gracilis]
MSAPVLISGTSRRVGRALALHLAESGFSVLAVNRRSLAASHPCIEQVEADLCRHDEREALIGFIRSRYQGLRGIIHNASAWLDDDLASLEQMYRLHIEAPFYLNLELGELLLNEPRADIIHICDESASRGSKNHIAYAATKAALLNMSLSFAERYAPSVRVNAISPGLLLFKEGSDAAYQQQALAKAALRFEPGAAPLLEAVDYLLQASYSTGSNIVVNGGRHLKQSI